MAKKTQWGVRWLALATAALIAGSSSGNLWAGKTRAGSSGEKHALLVAKRLGEMMKYGRGVISAEQKAINSDEGFTPPQFTSEFKSLWKEKGHFDYDAAIRKHAPASKICAAMMAAMEKAVSDAQPIINRPNAKFKGFLPALFARMAFNNFNATNPEGIVGKLTALNPRNMKNSPDDWEQKGLDNFIARDKSDPKRAAPIYEIVNQSGRRVLRYITPEFYTGSCLNCHGEPKGAMDISGYPKEGYKDGYAGSGLSFTLPL